jgi:hypothetical protein
MLQLFLEGLMSGIDNEATGRHEPDVQLSRRSLVAAGALMATLGGSVFAKKASADQQQEIWDLCNKHSDTEPPLCSCFLAGTHLLTPTGEVEVDGLSIGDLIATERGEARAIRWIGRIRVDRQGGAPWHADAMPVRVAKDAFGKDSPHRDLYLSRSHMVHLNGVLIPVGDLINGRTIVAVDVPGDQIVYYHVELETHDVLVAEGAPCESFLTTARKLVPFDNADEYYELFGAPADMAPCAPLAAFVGGRSELKSRLRSAIAVIVDIREPRDVARDHLELRAIDLSKAA